MKKLIKMIASVIIVILGFLILMLDYVKNFFHIVDQSWFSTWQNDSEWLVWQRISDDIKIGFSHNFGLLGDYNASPIGQYDINHAAYTAQIGLQGFVFGLISRIFSNISPTILYSFSTAIFILCIFLLLYWIKSEFGNIAAVLIFISLCLNQWIIVSARNLYWVIWTFLLPFIVSLIILKIEEKKEKNYFKWLIILNFFALFFRFGCGYEFTTLVMINCEAPLFYYAYKNKWKIKKIITRFIFLAIDAMLAFGISFVFCLTQVYFYEGKSWSRAISVAIGRIAYRTGAFKSVDQFSGMIKDSLEASKLSVIGKYFSEGYPIIYRFRMDVIILFILIGVCLTFVNSKTIMKHRDKLISLIILSGILFLGPLSWFILATGHSYIHQHICYILWSLPFLIFGLTITFANIGYLLLDAYKKIGIKFKIALVVIMLIAIVVCYKDITRPGTFKYNEAIEDGKVIYNDRNESVYYYENALYYYVKNTNERFFLHFYPVKSENLLDKNKFNNEDFDYTTYKIRVPFWKKYKLAYVPLEDDYGINQIETGQFNSKSTTWQCKFKLEDYVQQINTLNVFNLTDGNWNVGYNKALNCFLIQVDGSGISPWYLTGHVIQLTDGSNVKISNVERHGNYFWIYTDIKIEPKLQTSALQIK